MPTGAGEPDGNNGGQTGGQAPPATDPKATPPATPENVQVPPGFEIIRTEDKNNLVASRDKNFNANQDLRTQFEEMRGQLDNLTEAQSKTKVLDTWFDENGSKYPLLDREDLDIVDNPDQIEAIATRLQAKAEKARNDAISQNQVVDSPMSEDELKAEEQALEIERKENPNSSSLFKNFIRHQLNKAKVKR
jgi:hypothetical protein